MKIAFIIVIYQTPSEEISRLKKEITDIGFSNYNIYIIDNTIINRGYAAGVNQGIRSALKEKCDYFFILNPDISLKGITKNNLLSGGEGFDVWGGAMKQNNQIYYGGVIDRLRMTGGLINRKPISRLTSADFVSGSLMIIKKPVVEKLGFFDENYFMYYEDVDFCYRARKFGFKVGIDSGLKYQHFEKSQHNSKKEFWLSKSRWRFFFKYGNLKQKTYEFFRLPKTLFETVIKRKFLVNFLSFNLSSFINKLLNFILFIFLVKYLKVEEYGIYNLIWAQSALFTPLVDLGTTSYGLVYLPTEKKDQFKTLFNLRLILSLVVFLLTILSSVFLFKNNINLISYTFLLSFTIFSNMFSGSYLIITSLKGKLFQSSILSVLFNIVLISSLIFTLALRKNIGLIFLVISAFYNIYSIVNYLLLKKDLTGLAIKLLDKNWFTVIKKSYVFVLIGIFANLYFKADLFLLNYLKGEKAVAVYSAGYKFLEALIFIAASYTISATPVLAKLAKGNYQRLIKRVKRDGSLLFVLGFVVSLIIFFFGPIFLPFILKHGYQPSITIAQIVCLALPFILINTIFYNFLYVSDKAHVVVYLFVSQFLINFLLNLWLIPNYSYFASAYLTVFSEIINTVISFIFVYENFRRRRKLVSAS